MEATRLLIEWDRNCGETLCEDDRWRRCIATFSHIVALATWLMRHVRLGAPQRAERAVKGDLHMRRRKALFSDFKQYKTSRAFMPLQSAGVNRRSGLNITYILLYCDMATSCD